MSIFKNHDRTRDVVLAELKACTKEITDLADSMGDCGGLQGMAVLTQHPRLRKRFEKLGREAEALGITPEDLSS